VGGLLWAPGRGGCQADGGCGKSRIAVEQRKKLAKKLKDIEASQRSTAKMLGVSHTTVERDLKDGTNVPPEQTEVMDSLAVSDDGGTNVPPEWFQGDADPAKLANRTGKDSPSRPRRGSIGVPATDGGDDGG